MKKSKLSKEDKVEIVKDHFVKEIMKQDDCSKEEAIEDFEDMMSDSDGEDLLRIIINISDEISEKSK